MPRLPAALLLVALGVAVGAQTTELATVLDRAVVLHQTGDLQGAAALYVQVLRAAPQAARVRANLGAAYAGLGRYAEAIVEYRLALEVEDDLSIRRNLALALQKAARTREAAQEARGILLREPGNRDALLLLANCSLQLGEHQAVVDLLRPPAMADPTDKAVAYLLGTALLELDQPEDAQVVMDRVFRDDTPEAHVLMALLYSKKQDWTNVLVEAERARSANPQVPLANYLYGLALLRSAAQSRIVQPVDWQGAVQAFRAELAIDPNHFESNLLVGNLLREEGQAAEALEHLRRAARIRPDDLAVRFSLGAACLATDRLEEARALLVPVGKAAPSHQPTQVQLAVLYARLGEAEEAAEARANAVRLQQEADARAQEGAADVVSDLLGRTSSLQATEEP